MGIASKDIEAIKKNYPALEISRGDEEDIIVGEIFLNHVYEDVRMTGRFTVEIVVPDQFPTEIPIVRELSSCIAFDYPHKNKGGQLCLASELELKLFFSQNLNICLFIEKYIIPYLYTYRYYEEYGVYPYGERSHGILGNIEYLMELFGVDDWGQIFDIMMYIARSSYRGHLECPCGSGRRIRNCHGTILKQVLDAKMQDDCRRILYEISRIYDRKGKNGKRN